MPLIDLRNHIIQKDGTWCDAALLAQETPFKFSLADTHTAGRLMLRWPGDVVSLTGPLRLRVTYQSENLTLRTGSLSLLHRASPPQDPGKKLAGSEAKGALAINTNEAIPINAASLQASTLYSYTLDVPAGEVWSYQFGAQDSYLRLGANHGTRVIIEAALGEQVLQPVAQVSDLPCDFAVADIQDTGRFFPAACEPCEPGAQIGLPPGGPTLAIPTADGGCIRPRFFNGMFITKEDLETEQRYMRMKLRMQNRASGQGVVWGLNVGKQGNTVCVLPGYGVDCCGNDLTVTTVYKVDIPTLLRDPAAAAAVASGRPQRMHLLLEYVECPSDPRPVHADPCGPGAERCEMSRIRETVRLRLVPPRDPSTAGPIQKFIERVKSLRAKYKIDDQIPERPTRAPFRLEITARNSVNESVTVRIRPGEPPDLGPLGNISNVIELRLKPAFDSGEFAHFTRGTVDARTLDDAGAEQIFLNHVPLAPDDFEFEKGLVVVPIDPKNREIRLTYHLSQWTTREAFAPEEASLLTGDLRVVLYVNSDGVPETEVEDKGVSVVAVELGADCSSDPCVPPGERPALPQLPWLHTDPIWNDVPADPKTLILAALGGWLTEVTAREQVGTSKESLSARRLIASALYDSAWLLFFGVEQGANRNDIHESMRQLFRAWCENLIYKGPQCAGEPHGVVIGCTQVTGGTLADIDPFGGRRWVMHYPLVSHWGAQFGVAPIDVTASRFFSTICCISGLPPVGSRDSFPALALELGTSYLTFGTPEAVKAELEKEGVEVVESKTVSSGEFIAHVIRALSQERGDEPRPERTIATRYTLGNPMAPKALSLVSPLEQEGRTIPRGERPIPETKPRQPAGVQPTQPQAGTAQPSGRQQPLLPKERVAQPTPKGLPTRSKKDKK